MVLDNRVKCKRGEKRKGKIRVEKSDTACVSEYFKLINIFLDFLSMCLE